MEPETLFWQEITQLVGINPLTIDRPKGTSHPRYPEVIYPFDYGFLENTTASDGGGIDIWIGSLGLQTLTGILCTFDTLKRDMEIKLLLGCTNADLQIIRQFHGEMYTLYIPNPQANP
jgi:inorganic pyrophosphatase